MIQTAACFLDYGIDFAPELWYTYIVVIAQPQYESRWLHMTGKEIVNLIRQLRENGMSDTKILDLIEYIETHDPKEQTTDNQK